MFEGQGQGLALRVAAREEGNGGEGSAESSLFRATVTRAQHRSWERAAGMLIRGVVTCAPAAMKEACTALTL